MKKRVIQWIGLGLLTLAMIGIGWSMVDSLPSVSESVAQEQSHMPEDALSVLP